MFTVAKVKGHANIVLGKMYEGYDQLIFSGSMNNLDL